MMKDSAEFLCRFFLGGLGHLHKDEISSGRSRALTQGWGCGGEKSFGIMVESGPVVMEILHTMAVVILW